MGQARMRDGKPRESQETCTMQPESRTALIVTEAFPGHRWPLNPEQQAHSDERREIPEGLSAGDKACDDSAPTPSNACSGMRTVKVEPTPTLLSTAIEPPWA